jgi:hypothetical protein
MPSMEKNTPHIIAVFPASLQGKMMGFPNEPFYFVVIARNKLCDPCPERNEGEQSSTNLAGQLGLENILSNLGKGRLPRQAKNACHAMTESLFHSKSNP